MKKRILRGKKALILIAAGAVLLCAYTGNVPEAQREQAADTGQKDDIQTDVGQTTDSQSEQEDYMDYFDGLKMTESYKGLDQTNPLMTQRFGADPYALVYDDRVYIYMTADSFEHEATGEVKENTYSRINQINVISTDDMVNFTDHGSIKAAGNQGSAKWANNSWAPAAAWKEIDGKPKFFLYFADSGRGIGVLQADSPTGPFEYPLGGPLISRETPECADVLWLFDPAVLMDDDGRAYLLVHHGDIYRFADDYHNLDSCMCKKVDGVGESPAMLHRNENYRQMLQDTAFRCNIVGAV